MMLEPPGPTQSITSAWLQPSHLGDLAHGADQHQGLLAPTVPFVLIPVQGSIQLTQLPPHAHPLPHTPTRRRKPQAMQVGPMCQ